jgi:lipopolysaccharide transport system ATP-binding protein
VGNTIIKTENLGKSYMIGHQSEGRQYVALRDVITDKAKEIWSRIKNPHYHTHQNVEEFWALKNINLEIKEGERLGIIGRNGAGKTTLLKVLSRITEPNAGRAVVRGRVASLLEVGTGFHPELTGRENIFLNGSILGMSRQEIKRKFDEIIAFAEVENFLDTPVKRYSSGMYVRLAFAVAAHIEPEVLVVDEVLAVGDAEFQKKAMGKMESVSKQGRTILFVSHNMSSISTLCDRAILLENGSIKEDGDASEVIKYYLDTRSSNNSNFVWQDLDKAPGNDIMRLHSARIVSSSGKIISDIDIKDDLKIEINYWNLKDGTKMWVGVHVFNTMDVHVFASSNLHSNSIIPDELWNSPQPKGLYRTECTIPGRLLNEGVYFINIAIGNNVLNVIAHEERVLEFNIVDTISQFQKAGKAHGGIIRPQLGWKTEAIN